MEPFKKAFLLFTFLSCGAVVILGADNTPVDVNAEIDRLHTRINNMRPAPETLGALVEQIQVYCKDKVKKPIDEDNLLAASKCVERHLNETQIVDDLKKAVPAGHLDNVFRDVCIKWPKVRGCLKEYLTIIEDCWDKGKEVIKIVDGSVRFFCSEDNGGERIALFVAEGGLQCLEKHGDGAKKCLGDINEFGGLPEDLSQLPTGAVEHLEKEELCGKVEQIIKCTSKELKKCSDVTPENMISSMLRYAGSYAGCNIKQAQLTSRTSSADPWDRLSGWLLLTIVGGTLLV